MGGQKYIKLKLEVAGNKLTIKIDCSQNIKKYFLTDYVHIEYDQDMTNISKSILYIPTVSNIITMAWAVGADIYVEELDKTFMESLGKIKQVFEKWHPQFSFSTNLYVENVISNQFNGEGYGLLFSGGVDALTSYLRHKDKHPDLFMVWNINYPVREYGKGLKQEWKDIHLIKTNMQQLLHNILLRREFKVGDWYESINHALCLLGLTAPLTTKGIGTVLIASSFTETNVIPWGSHPLIDNNVAWANVKVIHDGFELSRQDKIKYIAQYPEYLSDLIVCNDHWHNDHKNCCRCEKCCRTITGLILVGIDPGNHNFNIDPKKILGYIKNCWAKGIFCEDYSKICLWMDIQKQIPEQLNNDIYCSKEFFTWLREFDFSNYKMSKSQHFIWGISGLVSKVGVVKTIKRVPRFIIRRLNGGLTRIKVIKA